LNQAALDYHEKPKPGKIVVELSKPTQTQRDLALAYSPGVAEPVRRIAPTFGGINVEDIAAPQCFEIGQAPKDLTRDPVPLAVLDADGLDHLEFGPHYILPKPLDARLKELIPPAVAGAAIDSGVARVEWPSHSPSRS
jgi:malic enzyme